MGARTITVVGVDVLIVVGDASPSSRLAARAHHVTSLPTTDLPTEFLAELRMRIPRDVGVIGVGAEHVAVALHRAGFPVTVYSDDRPEIEGVRVLPITDTGAPMEVAD